MTNSSAVKILSHLLNGINPLTGEILPDDHICNDPQVIRALHKAIISLGCTPDDIPPSQNKLNAGRPWTVNDNALLREMYNAGASIKDMCKTLQRRERGLCNQLAFLGLTKSKALPNTQQELQRAGTPWTLADNNELEALFAQKLPIEEIATIMKRSPYAIYCHMERQGLYADIPGYPQYDGKQMWTYNEIQQLKKRYANGESISELSKHFGRSERNIGYRLFYMGLLKDMPIPGFME